MCTAAPGLGRSMACDSPPARSCSEEYTWTANSLGDTLGLCGTWLQTFAGNRFRQSSISDHRALSSFLSVADTSLGGDAEWRSGIQPDGVFGPMGRVGTETVQAATVYNGELVIAGQFASIDGTALPGIASYNGARWRTLGAGVTFFRGARVLATYGDRLIAGGSIASAETASCVVEWNGRGWQSMGEGLHGDGLVSALAAQVFEGGLVVAGAFARAGDKPAQNIARWDGTAWHAIGADTLSGPHPCYFALAVFQDQLYAAGRFQLSRGTLAGNLARWNGQHWEIVGGGTNGQVHALAVYDSLLVLGGTFTRSGEVDSNRLASWDGQRYAAFAGDAVENRRHNGYSQVERLWVHEGKLFVAGDFDSVAGRAAPGIAAWDGVEWMALCDPQPPGFDRVRVQVLASHDGRLIVGGDLHFGPWPEVGRLAAWEGNRWTPITTKGVRVAGPIFAFLPAPEGLYAAGIFRRANEMRPIFAVAVWNGAVWEIAGDADGPIVALARFRGQLVAGGYFQHMAGVPSSHVAAWDGKHWLKLGTGVDDLVASLAVYKDRLIAGGDFSKASGVLASRIAEWDGQSWHPLGLGLSSPSGYSFVSDLQVYGNDLYVAGLFESAGGRVARGIASWNGETWSTVGSGLGFKDNIPRVFSAAIWNGRLVVYAHLESVDGAPTNNLALWNGAEWRPVAPPFDGIVSEIGTYEGRLVVGGLVSGAGTGEQQHSTYVLQYDGARWYRMGAGLSSGNRATWAFPNVMAIATWKGSLFFGGYFFAAGDEISPYFARWDGERFGLLVPNVALQVMPNPVKRVATLQWFSASPGPLRLRLFDVRGRLVASLREGYAPGGLGSRQWVPTNQDGAPLAAGAYFMRIETPAGWAKRKICVIR